VTFDTATVLDGRLVLISAIRTQPNIEVRTTLEPAAHPIAVTTETLDDDDLAELAHSLFLGGMTFAPEPLPDLSSLPVSSAAGEELGSLAWASPRPGSEIVTTMAPILAAAGLVFVGLGGLAAWLAHAHARHLVSEQMDARHGARTDSMTGLPNRLAFREHLALLESRRIPHAGVLFIDLNGFKAVNDSVGHAGGDALVAGVAERLARLTGEGTFLARLGGDEFVFVLSGESGVALRAGVLTQEVVDAVAEPFSVLGHSVHISLSQGLALRDAPDPSLDELVRQADLAMYRAKRDRAEAERPLSPRLHRPGRSQASEDPAGGETGLEISAVH
jgi:diguanylate cyclase (GGDEF)-like protein